MWGKILMEGVLHPRSHSIPLNTRKYIKCFGITKCSICKNVGFQGITNLSSHNIQEFYNIFISFLCFLLWCCDHRWLDMMTCCDKGMNFSDSVITVLPLERNIDVTIKKSSYRFDNNRHKWWEWRPIILFTSLSFKATAERQ